MKRAAVESFLASVPKCGIRLGERVAELLVELDRRAAIWRTVKLDFETLPERKARHG